MFFLASILQKGLAIITNPIYTRLLSLDEFGYISAYYSLKEVLAIFATFCLSYGVFNVGMVEHKDDRNVFTFSLIVLSNIITVLVFIITFAVSFYVDIGIDKPLIVCMFITFLFSPAMQFWTVRQKFESKCLAFFIVTIVSSILSSAFSILAIMYSNLSNIYSRIIISEVTISFIDSVIYFLLAKKALFKVRPQYMLSSFKYNLPLIPNYLSLYILSSSDKLMIKYLVGDSYTAIYSVAYTISSLVSLVWAAINATVTPAIFNSCAEKNYVNVKAIANKSIFIMLFTSIFIFLFCPEIIKIIASDEYYEGILIIPTILAGTFISSIYNLFSNVLFFHHKQVAVAIGSIVASIFNVVLNYIFIKQFGYTAAAYTTVVCYFIQLIVNYVVINVAIKEKIYGIKMFLIPIFICSIMAVSGIKVVLLDFFIRFIIFVIITICFLFVIYEYKKHTKKGEFL